MSAPAYNPDILPRGAEWDRIWTLGPGCSERVNCTFGISGPCLNPKHGAVAPPGLYNDAETEEGEADAQ